MLIFLAGSLDGSFVGLEWCCQWQQEDRALPLQGEVELVILGQKHASRRTVGLRDNPEDDVFGRSICREEPSAFDHSAVIGNTVFRRHLAPVPGLMPGDSDLDVIVGDDLQCVWRGHNPADPEFGDRNGFRAHIILASGARCRQVLSTQALRLPAFILKGVNLHKHELGQTHGDVLPAGPACLVFIEHDNDLASVSRRLTPKRVTFLQSRSAEMAL